MVLSKAAENVYDDLDFKTDAVYNKKAPEPWITVIIAAVFTIAGLYLFYKRYSKTMRALNRTREDSSRSEDSRTEQKIANPTPYCSSRSVRAAISAYSDNDSSSFTIIRTISQCLWLLVGLQYDYKLAFLILMTIFAIESAGDSLRVLLAVHEAHQNDDGKILGGSSRNMLDTHDIESHKGKEDNSVYRMAPGNIYEDLTRDDSIVVMVFVTQVILTSLVITDIYRSDTIACLDGTEGCPVAGTFGSYGLFLLGAFLTCVYILGPKSNFGQSEQDPKKWFVLLWAASRNMRCSWQNKNTDNDVEIHRDLKYSDWKLWTRFIMNFIVNGICFKILIHALAIQIASQSNLVIVVFRVTGMVFIVNLDDSTGDKLTFRSRDTDSSSETNDNSDSNGNTGDEGHANQNGGLTDRAEAVIRRARAELNALSTGTSVSQSEQEQLVGQSLALAESVVDKQK